MSQTGHFIIYYIEKWHFKNVAREEVLAGVPDSYLKMIEYNSDIKWEEDGKEFSLKGKFYDVVRITKNNGKTFLYCLKDENEEQLVKIFTKTIPLAASDKTAQNNKHSFKNLLTDQYIISFAAIIIVKFITKHSFINYEAALVSNYKEILIPPPWSAIS